MDTDTHTHPTVLVVDDDEDMLILLQHTLVREGYYPIFSPNAKNIMAILTQRKPDIVLLDINMKGMNGADICKQIKTDPSLCAIPVVMYSANDNIEQVTRECGADAYIAKPFVTGKLRTVFKQIFKNNTQ